MAPTGTRESGRTALIAGASGLVGSHLLQLLLRSKAYGKVISLGRRPLSLRHPKLEQHQADFAQLPDFRAWQPDDVYCCLGTTIRKAGSKAAFRQVDYDYLVALAAKTARLPEAQFLLITAMGADPGSGLFYNRVKGEAERDIRKLPLHALHIIRPSLLLGERTEMRTGELLAQKTGIALQFLFTGPLKKYKPIPAEVVAAAMVQAALRQQPGPHVYLSDQLFEMAKQAPAG